MIVLGVILLIIGFVAAVKIIWILGVIAVVVCSDVDLGSHSDWDICIVHCVSCSDLWTFGVEGNGNGTTGHLLLSFSCIVDDRLVVLRER